MATKATQSAPQAIALAPGMAIVGDGSKVRGGKQVSSRTTREDERGARVEIDREVEIRIPDKIERADADALRAEITQAIRSRSTCTIFGYIVGNVETQRAIENAIAEIASRIGDFNARARYCRVSVSVAFAPIALDSPACARAIAGEVRERLEEVSSLLRAGSASRSALLKCRGLASLGTGPQGDAIRFAIEESEQARKRLSKVAEGARIGEVATIEGEGGFGMLDSAIALWTQTDPVNDPAQH